MWPPSPKLALPLLLFVALVVGPEARAETDLEPPEICWRKGPRALGVRVTAVGGSHLNPSLPLLLSLDDGTYYKVGWTEPVKGDEAIVHLPRVAGEGSDGWTLELSGGVCNDDKSICLAFHAEAEVPARGQRRGRLTAEPGPPPRAEVELPAKLPEADPSKAPHPGATWFHAGAEPGVDAAFTEAQASDRNLLVDFYAAWCPPCDRLRDEFLSDPRRHRLLAGFVLLKADADHAASFDLKDRYRIGGYPTVLVLDPEGLELDRILGYDGQADRLAERLEGLREASGWEEIPADAEPIDVLRRLVAADRIDEATDLLLAMDPRPAVAFAGDYAALELVHAGLEDQPPETTLEVTLALADAAPSPGLAASWADSTARALDELERSEQAAALRLEFEARLSAVLGSRAGVEATVSQDGSTLSVAAPFQRPDALDDLATAAWYRGKWAEPEAAKALRVEGAAALAAAIRIDELSRGPLVHAPPAEVRFELTLPDALVDGPGRDSLARHEGRVHDLVDLLDAAELPDVSEPIYRAMVERFPDGFTWHYALAGFLRDQRGGEGAIGPARAALLTSYGDNRLRAARRLAELLRADEQIDEALAVVDEALAAPAPEQENVRTWRYRTALEELRGALTGSEPR